jgi:type 1 glutamine amidotransferase
MRIAIMALVLFAAPVVAADPWVMYRGGDGPGHGKKIVLISGDEEYRSEEMLTQLGRILAKHHGFDCTVLYAVDPKDGTINPNVNNNIPGLDALKSADLMVIETRYRDLPDEQMKYIVDYLESGKPVIGVRTATHAFKTKSTKYAIWDCDNKEWPGGFGRQILGECWVNHHGSHGKEGTRGRVIVEQSRHPILRGIKDSEIFGPTDVYGIRLPMPADCTPLLLGEVTTTLDAKSPPVAGKQNDPMMPVAWTKTNQSRRVFATTLGASQDFANEAFRRLMVNACYWAVGLEDLIPAKANVGIVGEFQPSPFGTDGFKKGVKPADLSIE